MEASSSTSTCHSQASPAPPVPAMKVLGMQGGAGEDSYANNSKEQNYMFHRYAKAHLSQTLDHVFSTFFSSKSVALEHQRNFCVADLGCSHGPNTLEYARFIVQGMQQRLHTDDVEYTSSHHTSTASERRRRTEHFEIQYLFSDLPSNDFNTLFQSLCPLGPQLQSAADDDENTDTGATLGCVHGSLFPLPPMRVFSAGVPGSFHGRLFPKDSLHLVVCAFAFHWLSQVPPSVVDKKSSAWNGGNVWIHGGRPKVVEAYAQQFREDAKEFLKSRAQELVKGGILFLFAISRIHEHPPNCFMENKDGIDFWMGDFQSTWQEMVHEGLITQEEMDMFNVPMYNFHRNELEDALESLVDDLEVINIVMLKDCEGIPHQLEQQLGGDPNAFGKASARKIASLIKPLVQANIGENRTKELFKRLHQIASKRANPTAKLVATPTFDTIIAIIRRC